MLFVGSQLSILWSIFKYRIYKSLLIHSLTHSLNQSLNHSLTHSFTLAGWLSDWLTDWLTNRLTDWPIDRPTDGLTDWLTDWLTDRLTDWLTDWQTDRLTDWLTDWQIHWLTDWLTDWLTYTYLCRFTFLISGCKLHHKFRCRNPDVVSQKVVYIINTGLGKIFCSISGDPIVLFTLAIICFQIFLKSWFSNKSTKVFLIWGLWDNAVIKT